jgi:hypothetical protein
MFNVPNFYLFIYLFMFGSTGGCTEDPMLAQQALYHLSHSISPTCLIFKKRTINMKCFFIGGTKCVIYFSSRQYKRGKQRKWMVRMDTK